ncbi:hypothetical protein O7635_29480 [Asanoa sp. WMMD1127]|uniref:hypothetical protein n=1 Tax=Asanoa sp. WMMD1127 TaxID=3016107 RepID=UPI00241723D3|nr:hypothetical protein [Asanoa sp. WMMD1127]MDG4826001.1 hypothetical protein [Asanoa sp. WMMD1127]
MFGITETRSAAFTVETTTDAVRTVVTEVVLRTEVRVPVIEETPWGFYRAEEIEPGAVIQDRDGNRFLVTGTLFGAGAGLDLAVLDLLDLYTGEVYAGDRGWRGETSSYVRAERTRLP